MSIFSLREYQGISLGNNTNTVNTLGFKFAAQPHCWKLKIIVDALPQLSGRMDGMILLSYGGLMLKPGRTAIRRSLHSL